MPRSSKRARVKARVVGDAPMFDIVFTDREVKDYRSALGDEATMKRCNALLRERGILKGESKYYISLAHTDEDVRLHARCFCRGDRGAAGGTGGVKGSDPRKPSYRGSPTEQKGLTPWLTRK